MNGITHFLVGIVITLVVWRIFSDKWAEKKKWPKEMAFIINHHPIKKVSILRIVITSILAFFSHALVDGFAIFTYHPYKNFDTLFYAIWTPSLLVSAAIVLLIALKIDIRYSYGLIFALFFDLWDYSMLPLINYLSGELDLNSLYLHQFEWLFINTFLAWAPVFYLNQWASLVEVVIIGILLLSWFFLENKKPLPINMNYQPKNYLFLIIAGGIGSWILLGEFL
jgi:hypothetical protein